MIYLSGVLTPELRAGKRPDVGLIAQPLSYVDHAAELVPAIAFDNGAFGAWRRGVEPNWERWWRWLSTRDWGSGRALFAVAPDVPGSQTGTLRKSLPYLERIRGLGLPVALAAQNGWAPGSLPWNEFDVLFLGGDDGWKLGDQAMLASFEAKHHGKWVHMGRVNSAKRLRWAAECGCDSVDGTFLRFGDNWPRLCGFLDSLRERPPLPAAVLS